MTGSMTVTGFPSPQEFGGRPCHYTESGITGIVASCPISGEAHWPVVMTDLGMGASQAQEWHRLLYAELRMEYSASPR